MDGQKLAELFKQATEKHQRGRFLEAQAQYARILKYVPDNFDVLHLSGQALIQAGRAGKAVHWLKRAAAVNPENADVFYDLALAYRSSGQDKQAVQGYRRVLDLQPDYMKAHLSLAEIKFPGEHYTSMLANLHRWLRPAAYLEIGVETGQSMSMALPETLCLGVDPEPKISYSLPPGCEIFSVTSDAFFELYRLNDLLHHKTLDFAFIDGMHIFESALRDFINIERYASPQTVVAVHDCIPLDAVTSSRQRTTTFWSGDVWKLVPCLKKYRPDLQLVNVAAKPTGLGLITGLDPENTVLSDAFEEIVSEFIPQEYELSGEDEVLAMNIIANDTGHVRRWLDTHALQQAC